MWLKDMSVGDMERYAYETASARRDAMAEAGIAEEECDRAYRRTYDSIEQAWWDSGEEGYDRLVVPDDYD